MAVALLTNPRGTLEQSSVGVAKEGVDVKLEEEAVGGGGTKAATAAGNWSPNSISTLNLIVATAARPAE
jgi:hypothetical protein